MNLQIAVDCADPHLLNRFWASLLGYEREDHGDLVRGLVERGVVAAEETVEVDGVLSFRSAAACRDPHGRGPRLLFPARARGEDGEEPRAPRRPPGRR